MALAGQVGVKFSADVAEYITATMKIKRENDGVNQSFKKVSQEHESMLKQLKSNFGKGSAIGEIGKLLAGKGAFAGVTFLLKETDEALKKTVELRDEYKKGAISAGEMADQIARSIPILGKVYSMGRSVHDMIFGSTITSEKVLADAKAGDEKTASLQRYMDAARDLRRTNDDLARDLQKPSFFSRISGIDESGGRAIEDFGAELKKKYAPIQKEISEKRAELLGQLLKQQEDAQPKLKTPGMHGQIGGGGDPYYEAPPADALAKVSNTQKEIDKLAARSAEIDAELTKASGQFIEKTRRGTFTAMAKEVGVEFIHGAEKVEAGAHRILAAQHNILPEAESILTATAGAYKHFQNQVAVLELNANFIPAAELGRAEGKIFWDGFADAFRDFKNPLDKVRDSFNANSAASDTLTKTMIERLAVAGSLGNDEARLAADRLRIEEEIGRKRVELWKITFDQRISAERRAAAQAELNNLPAMQKAMEASLQSNYAHPSGTPQLSAQFSTNNKDTAPAILAETKKTNSFLDKLVQAAKAIPQIFTIGP